MDAMVNGSVLTYCPCGSQCIQTSGGHVQPALAQRWIRTNQPFGREPGSDGRARGGHRPNRRRRSHWDSTSKQPGPKC